MPYEVTHEETGRVSVYPDAATYEAAWDWFEATSEPDVIAWYTAGDRATNKPPRDEIWTDEDRTALAADWADVVTAAHAWACPPP